MLPREPGSLLSLLAICLQIGDRPQTKPPVCVMHRVIGPSQVSCEGLCLFSPYGFQGQVSFGVSVDYIPYHGMLRMEQSNR